MKSAVHFKKSVLRAKLEARLSGLTAARRKNKSRRILKRFLASSGYRKCVKILVYVSFRNEVETRPLIRRALKDGKEVFVPRVRKEGNNIRIYRIRNMKKDLKKGAYGIWEPHVSGRAGRPSELDLIVVPGLGFDRKGRRLGRGFGFYDRFLAKAAKAEKIGLAFREQMTAEIPAEKHDVPVHRVITD